MGRAITVIAGLLLGLPPLAAQPAAPRLVRSISGPSGKVVGAKFVFDETRTRFVYPQDKALSIYFEWEAPPGDHTLTGIWKDPGGKVTSISPEIKMQTSAPELNAYWVFELYPSTGGGVWTLEIRIDGQPAGSHSFEVVMPPAPSAAPSIDQIYQTALKSMVWIHRLDAMGRRIDSGSGFVVAKDRIATEFQVIDCAASLQIEFPGGRTENVTEIWGVNRLQDWALVRADTKEMPVLPRDESKTSYIGERLIILNVEANALRTIAGVDISAHTQDATFGDRIRFGAGLAAGAAGGPIFTAAGNVVGILGGSVVPSSRLLPRNRFESNEISSATPITLVPVAISQPPTPLKTLVDLGTFASPVASFTSFEYGSTATSVPRDLYGVPQESREFYRKDPAIWVYTLWQKRDKSGKGSISAKVYDALNRVRMNIASKKASLNAESRTRFDFSFAPKDLERGTYRVDVLWDDQVVWRTFVNLVD